MAQKKVVIALGGNAIQLEGRPATAEEQQKACEATAIQLAELIENGYQVIVTHGNGPQVGNIVLQQQAAVSDKLPAMPLDTCDAMSQGMIGYWLQQAIDVVLAKKGIDKRAVTLLTQVVVDPKDSAFQEPTKPIGQFYSEEEANKIAKEKGFRMKEDAGRGWRRVVPSPRPVDIIEQEIVKDLIEKGRLVIAAGGGGIPVIRKDNHVLEGVEAVIDKDFASEKLAELIDADILLILTAVDTIAINFKKPNQKELTLVTPEEMVKYKEEGHFAPGSMLPKVEAALLFVNSKPGRTAIITSLENASKALRGESGTRVVSEPVFSAK